MVLNPLVVTPAVSVRIFPDAGITPLGSKSFSLSAQVHTEAQAGAKGTVRLDLPGGWHSEPASAPFALDRAGQEQIVRFQVSPTAWRPSPTRLRPWPNPAAGSIAKALSPRAIPGCVRITSTLRPPTAPPAWT